MGAGAWLMLLYLDDTGWAPHDRLAHTRSTLNICCLGLLLVRSRLAPESARTYRDISPRWSGVIVVGLTGIVAAFASFSLSPGGAVSAATILTVTVALAVWIWRFASVHAEEIGERRVGQGGRLPPG